MTKDRGMEHAQRCMTDIIGIIRNKIKKNGKVRILEAGCGYGVAIMDLIKIFGDKIDISGFNLKPSHGNHKIIKKEAIKKGIFTKDEIKSIKLPKIYYLDASKRLPFKDNTFDLVYSQTSMYLYADKAHFLEECSRILTNEGIAIIAPSFEKKKQFPEKYWRYYELWVNGKEIPFWDYIRKFKGVKVVWKNRDKKGGDKPMFIEIKKQKKLDFKLKLVAAIDYHKLNKEWFGVKSIYTRIK